MRAALLVVGLFFAAATAVPVAAHANHVTATPQVSPDGTVYIESAFAIDTVWIVLHDDAGGGAGRPIGQAFLDPSDGPLNDVAIEIAPRAWANTEGSRTVWVDLYFDDGDGTFDASGDEPLSRSGLFRPFSFTVSRGDARAYVGAGDVSPQRTAGTVDVRRVILPAEGHLVIRNDSNGNPGATVGHTTLQAGNHTAVSVRLDRTFFENRPSSFRVWAMLYVDDGNGTFDDGDRPITAGNETVGSRFRLDKRESSPTPTPEEAELVTTPTDERPVRAPTTDSRFGVSTPGFGLAITAVALVIALVVAGYLRE